MMMMVSVTMMVVRLHGSVEGIMQRLALMQLMMLLSVAVGA